MKRIAVYFCLLSSFTTCLPSAVTFELNGRFGHRFGNGIWAFSLALWLAYKNDMPLVYTPFEHGEELKASQNNKNIGNRSLKSLVKKKIKSFTKPLKKNSGTLYILPWTKKSIDHIDWNDTKFIALLRKNIAPITPIIFEPLPSNRHAVAMHIRIGSGPDSILDEWSVRTWTQRRFPEKFPPKSFYLEQLIRLSSLLNDEPMYVHIFTDHENPEKIIEQLEASVQKANIMYGFEKRDVENSSGVLKDFFDMTRFEYFIRPNSTFSYMAEKLANWKLSISAHECKWKDDHVVVTKVLTEERKP